MAAGAVLIAVLALVVEGVWPVCSGSWCRRGCVR